MQYAIITPYYQESRATLERCLRSVRAQTVRSEHIVVADGYPQDWIDGLPVRHLKLDSAHGDLGNTPRGVAAMLAVAERYDAICFLDADNWLEPDHVAECLRAADSVPGGRAECDYVTADRIFRRPDATAMFLVEEPNHVDTSCFFYLPGAYFTLPYWAMMPSVWGPYGDRAFAQMLRGHVLQTAKTSKATVNYTFMYEGVYRRAGETPPEGAKPDLIPFLEAVTAWTKGMSARERQIASRLMGFDLASATVQADPDSDGDEI